MLYFQTFINRKQAGSFEKGEQKNNTSSYIYFHNTSTVLCIYHVSSQTEQEIRKLNYTINAYIKETLCSQFNYDRKITGTAYLLEEMEAQKVAVVFSR